MKIEESGVEPQRGGDSGNVIPSSPAVSSNSKPTINGAVDELPKRIMVPLDGSEFSFRAAQYAINLARLTGGEILCIHSITDLPYTEYSAPAGITIPHYIQEAKNRLRNGFHKSN